MSSLNNLAASDGAEKQNKDDEDLVDPELYENIDETEDFDGGWMSKKTANKQHLNNV
jgi:hypothetical protein